MSKKRGGEAAVMRRQEFAICREFERNCNQKPLNLNLKKYRSPTSNSISTCVKNSNVTSEAREGSICAGAETSN